MSCRSLTRRKFIKASAAGTFAFQFVPSRVFGANERVAVAGIGSGGKGASDIAGASGAGADIVALCDVDDSRAAGTFRKFPKAKRFKDFRKMLEKMGDTIDAVTVSTPDHMHFHGALHAIRRGKHVYVQKPLTHSIWEARTLAREAAKHKVITQMGNQAHAGEPIRRAVELIRAGIVGKVKEVHTWTNRPIWPQGVTKPLPKQDIPKGMDWEQWIGPAPMRDYNAGYAPFKWRGWWDFGTGAMGDMGCHIVDHPIWALELGSPTSVESVVTLDGSELEGKPNREMYPIAAVIHYEFPSRGQLPPVKMTWYEGGLMPPTPEEMKEGERLPGNGVLYIGSKGKMYHGSHGGMPTVLPHGLGEVAKGVARTMERSPGHHREWLDACRGEGTAMSNFSYSGPLTETVLLGVLSLRAPGQRLKWDGEKMKITNAPQLDQFVHKQYRKGWTL
ncbi:MAG: Gfo/Idh/MocA family oxidoreductase [Verrucomicrobiales bacterium]